VWEYLLLLLIDNDSKGCFTRNHSMNRSSCLDLGRLDQVMRALSSLTSLDLIREEQNLAPTQMQSLLKSIFPVQEK